ncbi:hypothetical protein EG329_013798 [Mollisiaceae sp. DMI_Dod_QoI]|nr:hypothetical protein EG329_013798 [Helotiales sp. DMI_Dod_QoI]
MGPPLPPAHYSLAWFRNGIRRRWAQASTGARVVSAATFIAFGLSFLSFAFKISFGMFHYIVAFFRSALWDVLVQDSCARIKRVSHPYWNLSNSDYFRWNRCLGNEAGFERQGQLWLLVWDIFFYPLGLFGRSPILILVLMSSVYFVGPWIIRKLYNLVIYACTAPWGIAFLAIFAPTTLLVLGFKFLSVIVVAVIIIALSVQFAMRKLTVADASQGVEAGAKSPTFAPIAIALRHFILGVNTAWQSMHDIPWMQQRDCRHALLCRCQDRLNATVAQALQNEQSYLIHIQELTDRLTDSEFSAESFATLAKKMEIERDNYRYMAEHPWNGNFTGNHAAYAQGSPRAQPDLTAAFDEARSRIGHLLAEADDVKEAHRRELAAWQAKVEKLQTEVNYSQGAGQDRIHAHNELENTKARTRVLERQLMEMTVTASTGRQALAKEKETHTERCQNEASCQRQILALQVACDKLKNFQLENDLVARQTAMQLRGLELKDVAHMTIRSVLTDLTVKMLELQAKGTPGFNTTDLQVDLIRREASQDTAYRNRLERELERLGGNVIDIRVGLDTTRPQDWKIEMLTYEQNHYRVFPIYEQLTQIVINLHDLLQATAADQLPAWQPEPARNDLTHSDIPPNPLELGLQIATANAFVNPTAPHGEALAEKLVVAECQRWYNRGVQLVSAWIRLCKDSHYMQKLTVEDQIHLTNEVVPQAERVLRRVLHDILIDTCLLKRDDTERQPTTREKKRFEIYTAMQHSISAMTKSIISNQKKPPRWPAISPTKDTPVTRANDLATILVVQEMINLEKRILQLKKFMIDWQMPGTIYGPMQSHIQGDNGRYSREWDERVTAITFAELTLSHWMVWKAQKPVQLIGDDGMPVLNEKKEPIFRPRPATDVQLLPLKWDDFMISIKLKNDKIKKQDKDKWPEDQVPTLFMDPHLSPRIKFVPKSELKDQHKGNKNPSSNDNQHNGNKNDDNSDHAEKQKARKVFETNNTRIQQLSNHVRDWGIKGSMALPGLRHLAKNAALQTIQKAIEAQKLELGMLSAVITNNHRSIPKWPKNGGPMKPK